MFTRDHGRVALLARARADPSRRYVALLLAFQAVARFPGRAKSELHSLVAAEWEGSYAPLRAGVDVRLLCQRADAETAGRLTTRMKTCMHPTGTRLRRSRRQPDHAAVLRRFELCLLGELAMRVLLDREADSGVPIAAEQRYVYVIERGPLPAAGRAEGKRGRIGGQHPARYASPVICEFRDATAEQGADAYAEKPLPRRPGPAHASVAARSPRAVNLSQYQARDALWPGRTVCRRPAQAICRYGQAGQRSRRPSGPTQRTGAIWAHFFVGSPRNIDIFLRASS